MPRLLYVVDVFSLVFQVFHAIPSMTGPKGQPTNAVFGFARDLLAIRDNKQPTHLICAMDSSGPGKRNELYADYKANRDEMPEDLRPQIPLIVDVMEGLQIPVIEYTGWEADDVIATVVHQAREQGFSVRIVTGDKDARQLLDEATQIYNCRKDTFLDADALMDDWGVRPDQVIDYQSMVGDSVDNVPGVPLVGPKKARTLLETYDTLDKVLANADNVSGKKLSENLKTYADQARMSRELVTLRRDLPIDVDWDAAQVGDPDRQRLYELFTDLGFRRLSQAMRDTDATDDDVVEKTVVSVTTPGHVTKMLSAIEDAAASELVVALDTASHHPRHHEIHGLAVSAGITTWHVSVDGNTKLLESIRPLFEADGTTISGHDLKRIDHALRKIDFPESRHGFDTMIADYLLDAGAREHDLATLCERHLDGRPLLESGSDSGGQKTMFEADDGAATQRVIAEAGAISHLLPVMREGLEANELLTLYDELERPLIAALAELEWNGIRIDTDELHRQSEQIGARADRLTAEIFELAGHEFNIDSPKQLGEVLFDELELPVIKRTKTGASTNQEVLEKLAPMHPLPEKIIERRQLTKLKSTYLDALPALVDPDTGRIHAQFHQTVASTGRLSSSDPNLQNIPIRTEEGRQVRKAFIAGEPGWRLLCADYSQIELRMLAHFSRDPELIAAFQAGADIHTAVAAEVFDVEQSAVDSNQRRIAKAVNFGIVYGQSPFGLAAALNISQDEAAEFIDNYFAKYSYVDAFMEAVLVETKRTGYARTILNRRRPIAGIRNTTGRVRNMPERTAINTVLQGSAADLIKRAMINIHHRLTRESHPARMLLQIHDELVFEVPESDIDSLDALVRDEMESAMSIEVPLVVDVSTGPNWLELEDRG